MITLLIEQSLAFTTDFKKLNISKLEREKGKGTNVVFICGKHYI